jgi:hypothetical protein
MPKQKTLRQIQGDQSNDNHFWFQHTLIQNILRDNAVV